mmetsp:Transcript_37273/g.111627  ORF Transcript_37273/g.111627 Transcript_37273/m.111627 type:complete len:214 (-) Transcript_37273:1036-1677(-)
MPKKKRRTWTTMKTTKMTRTWRAMWRARRGRRKARRVGMRAAAAKAPWSPRPRKKPPTPRGRKNRLMRPLPLRSPPAGPARTCALSASSRADRPSIPRPSPSRAFPPEDSPPLGQRESPCLVGSGTTKPTSSRLGACRLVGLTRPLRDTARQTGGTGAATDRAAGRTTVGAGTDGTAPRPSGGAVGTRGTWWGAWWTWTTRRSASPSTAEAKR